MQAQSQVLPSVCPLDCPDTCSLSVEVQNDKVIKVRGSDANRLTGSVICNKVARYYPEFVHGSNRLTTPLQRTGPRGGGQYKPVSWEVALDLVYRGLRQAIAQHGPESVVPFNYAGPHGQLAGGSMDRRFFYRLGASQLDRGPLCGAVRGTAYTSLFGSAAGFAPEQAIDSEVIAVWGNNVTVSNLHLMPVINKARKKGAKLVVIDPKRTKIAEQADLYLQIQPGTDVVLALAMAAELEKRERIDHDFVSTWALGFDVYMQEARRYSVDQACRVCGISATQFEQLFALYSTGKRLSVSTGNGMERGHSGGSALRAIMALNVLTGQLGQPGSGVIAKAGLSFPYTSDRLQRPDLIPDGTRTLNIVDLGKLMLDKTLATPIKAVFIYNHNPVCTHPDQNRMRRALAQEDLFVVGSDIVMTDSMKYADVILPASSSFELDDIYGAYGQSYLQRAAAVIRPVAQSLPNTEIFRRLAARFGFTETLFQTSDSALIDEAIDGDDTRLGGVKPSALPLDHAIEMNTTDGEASIICKNMSPGTRSGKIELFSQDLQDKYGYGVPRYQTLVRSLPLILISPSSSRRTNATFGDNPASSKMEALEINPADALARDIVDKQVVIAFNSLGEVHLSAVVTDAVPVGVVYSPKGTWLSTSDSEQTVNALIDADLRTDICDGACYNDTTVEVRAKA